MPPVNVTPTPDGRLSRANAARYLGFSASTLANWSLRNYGPKGHKVAGRVFYYTRDLDAFIGQGVLDLFAD